MNIRTLVLANIIIFHFLYPIAIQISFAVFKNMTLILKYQSVEFFFIKMLALLTCILVSCYKLGKISLFGLYWEQFRNTLQKMTINSKFAFWNLESFIAKEKKEEIRADEFDVRCGASQQDRIWGENQDKIFLEKPWEVREKGRVVCRMSYTQIVKLSWKFQFVLLSLCSKNEIDLSIFQGLLYFLPFGLC